MPIFAHRLEVAIWEADAIITLSATGVFFNIGHYRGQDSALVPAPTSQSLTPRVTESVSFDREISWRKCGAFLHWLASLVFTQERILDVSESRKPPSSCDTTFVFSRYKYKRTTIPEVYEDATTKHNEV